MTQSNRARYAAVVAVTAFLLAGAGTAQAQQIEQLIDLEKQVAQAGAQSQANVDKIADETDRLLQEYRTVMTQIDNIKVYNAQLQDLVKAQGTERQSLATQIENVSAVEREIVPLMQRMIGTLEQFVNLDVPFLSQERQDRVQSLRTLMARADVSTSEKYRRLMEAYQIENEYGRTIEAYDGPLEQDGRVRQVSFLRFGRVLLAYQTLDGKEQGMWDQRQRQWVVLPESYRGAIRQGLAVARRQAAPDLIVLPVPAPEAAQ
ncbi:DUF3450 domain-containing protein [Rhodocista pekingensis]|uniref:DUF3450 domain-containing protein n=1 Tax=Rhodocista pekingensis TaxID=201185 RepID=A0ABW2KR31_9PROT